MGYRNPLTSLPADNITSGTFSGTYRNAGTFVLAGTPGASRIEASGSELAFYAADGTTKLIDLNTASGAGVIQSTSIEGSTITGGLIQTAAAPAQRVYLDGANGLLGIGPTNPLPGTYSDAELLAGVVTASGRVQPQLVIAGPNSVGATSPVPSIRLRATDATNVNQPLVIIDGGDVTLAQILLQNAKQIQLNRGAGLADIWAGDTQIRGQGTQTTDANGRITITHNLGVIPTAVGCFPASADGGTPILGYFLTPKTGWSTTTFIARAVSTTGAAMASTSVTYSWCVWA